MRKDSEKKNEEIEERDKGGEDSAVMDNKIKMDTGTGKRKWRRRKRKKR